MVDIAAPLSSLKKHVKNIEVVLQDTQICPNSKTEF
jgi:hypothetical protein